MKQTRRRWLRFAVAAAVAVTLAAMTALPAGRGRVARGEPGAAARLAVRRLAAGDARAARRLADAVIRADPGQADALFVRACLRAAGGDRPGALADLEACAAGDADDFVTCLDAGLVARQIEPRATDRADAWFDAASRRAQSALTRDPADARAAIVCAAADLARGRIDDARRRLDALAPVGGRLADDVDAIRAAILVARGDAAGAAAMLRRAVGERGSRALAAMLADLEARSRSSLRDGIDALRHGDAAAARALLRGAVREAPGDLSAVPLLAATIAGPDTSREVEEEARRLDALDPGGAARALLVASVLLANDDAAGAAPLFRRALERAPGDATALRGAVLTSIALDDAAAAARMCRARLARGDASGAADFLLGAVLEHQGESALAETSFRDALGKDAANWEASDRLAELLLRRGDVAGAASVCDAGLACEPDCLPLRIRRAGVWVAAGEARRAASMLEADAAVHPACAAVHLHWARALVALGDADGAAARLDACLRADPACVEAHVGAVAASAAAGRLDVTIDALRARIAEAPADAVLRFALGVAAETAGHLAVAEREYRTALCLAPRFGAAANNLAWLLATRLERPAEARPFAETAGRLLPRNPQVLDTRGWVRFLTGDLDGAEPDLARAAGALAGRADVAARHAAAAQAIHEATSDPRVSEPETEVPR